MSSVIFNSSSKKFGIYIVIILSVICINMYGNRKYLMNSFNLPNINRISLEDTVVNTFVEPDKYNKQIKVESGYSIDSLLLKEDINESDVISSSRALKKIFDPRDLKAGTKITINYDWLTKNDFLGYEIDLDFDKSIVVNKDSDGFYDAKIINKTYKTSIFHGKGVIDETLYQSAIDSGISPNIIMNLIQLYSFDIDFQRDIHKGAKFEIIYENYLDDLGKFVKHGNILASILTVDDRRFPIYRFTTSDGKTDYYNEDGKSARKALLKTPVNGAYISSTFGMRVHPIEGYTAFHRGTDFAVKQGTPIYASGDGVITAAIISDVGYGIHIKIKHPNGYETLYGHMVSFAKGMAPGVRVTQGQVIGYVGSTGASTGPHLHYETRYNGQFVNPASIKIPPGRTLEGDELKSFYNVVSENKLSI
ncbi:MAG: M23 family metallopeptidase [Spirochaetales bacterium]|nr:M23 family metallopeptidase [Spirochaetales bacterium]